MGNPDSHFDTAVVTQDFLQKDESLYIGSDESPYDTSLPTQREGTDNKFYPLNVQLQPNNVSNEASNPMILNREAPDTGISDHGSPTADMPPNPDK